MKNGTAGIYKLAFKGTHKVYIGQSLNIEKRYITHLYLMREQKSSYKLNTAYIDFGNPDIHILQVCDKDQLDDNEEMFIVKYNSVKDGFNTVYEAGYRSDSFGAARYNSLADSATYECILYMLALTDWTYKDIATEVSVTVPVVKDISRGHTHTYLKESHPEAYTLMQNKLGLRISGSSSAKARGIIYPKVVSPLGIVYSVENATNFAKLHYINIGNFNSLLNNKRASANKWKLVKES